MSNDRTSNKNKLKEINIEEKKLRERKKAIRDELNQNKEVRKDARSRVIIAKNNALEARSKVTKAVRGLNNVMLTKSIKKNLDEFKSSVDEFYESANAIVETSNELIEALEEFKKYE